MPLLRKVAQILCQLLLRPVFWPPSSKVSVLEALREEPEGPVLSLCAASLEGPGPSLEMLHRESDLRKQQPQALAAQSKDNQERALCSLPHQKQTSQLAPHHPRKQISLSMVLKYRQGNEIAPLTVCQRMLPSASLLFSHKKWITGKRAALLSSFSYLAKNPKVYFSYLWFYLSVQVYQIKHRFWSGWILKGKGYFLSTFYFVDQKKLSKVCNYSGISSK